MADIFQCMIALAKLVGTVTDAHMYGKNFLTIDGKTEDGKAFSLNLHIKEEEKND